MSGADIQLRWVKKNWGKAHEPEQIGRFVRAVPVQGMRDAASRRREALSAVVWKAGIELARQVRSLREQGGVLYLEVDDPVTLYHLRIRWEQELLDILRTDPSVSDIGAVRFTTRGHIH